MANNYFLTLFLSIVLALFTAANNLWQHLPLINTPLRFTIIIMLFFLVTLYGFTNAIKANNDAKFYSYLCSVLTLLLCLLLGAPIIMTSVSVNILFILLLASTVVSALYLALHTRRKTRSYF